MNSFRGRLVHAWSLVVAAALFGLLLGGTALTIALLPTATRTIASVPRDDQAALVERGRYLAVAGDCAACHTAPGGGAFAGGLPIASPIGTIYSTNITPDRSTGIGNQSLAEFDRALRHGIRRDGATLYPAMPYPSYAHVTDDDVRALYAYFMAGVAPVDRANRPVGIPWPLSMRWPLALWRKAFAPNPDAIVPIAYPDPVVARGAYLVQGLGHCGSCHTPRRITLQEEALDERGQAYLKGGAPIDGWVPVNLRADAADGMGLWTAADIAATLRDARNAHAAVVGHPMSQVVQDSTQHLTDADRQAIARYLKTLPPSHDGDVRFDPRSAASGPSPEDPANSGGALYLDNCAACHRSDAKGAVRSFPTLRANPTVLASDPRSLIRVVLGGSALPSLPTAPSALAMPGFAWRLTDDEVATLTSFVRQNWGNRAAAVTPREVAAVRKDLESVQAATPGAVTAGNPRKQQQ